MSQSKDPSLCCSSYWRSGATVKPQQLQMEGFTHSLNIPVKETGSGGKIQRCLSSFDPYPTISSNISDLELLEELPVISAGTLMIDNLVVRNNHQ